jgi:3-phytase
MGKLYSYGLSGQAVQTTSSLNQPGLVDIKYGFVLGGQTMDLAAVAESGTALIHFYSIDRMTGQMTEVTGFTAVFKDRGGDAAVPVGLALYKRPSDNLGFLVVSPRSGPMTNYLYQYRLDYTAGRIDLTYVRQFGDFSTVTTPGDNDVKGVLVDDALGYLYYSDKSYGIRKYLVDPNAPNANTELTVFGMQEFMGDRNGLAVYANPDGTGYLLSVDQTPVQTRILFWRRQGEPGNPHNHTVVSTLVLNADFTDGIEVTSAPLGSQYPSGLLAVSNRSGKNFLYYSWKDVVDTLSLK